MYENNENNDYNMNAPYTGTTPPVYTTPYAPPRKKSGFGNKFAAVAVMVVLASSSLGLGLGLGNTIGNGLNAANNPPVSDVVEAASITIPSIPELSFKSETSENVLPKINTNSMVLGVNDSDVVNVIKTVSNSVVSINVSSTYTDIFNRSMTYPSAGSGIICSEDTENIYIVTNNHVIEDAQSVEISIDDDITVSASPMGSDKENDIAVIKVAKADLIKAGVADYAIAVFGDAGAMEVGETVIAIGNAMGEGKSATLGIISAKNKQVTAESNNYVNVIQTDAAINRGNSGGALVNLKGQVIGINTVKVVSTGTEGMGYAIPSNIVKEIVDEIMKEGSVERPFLGISGVTVDERIKEIYSLPSLGVYVAEISETSGAKAAGMKQGDIITVFNGVSISDMQQLQDEIAKTTVGSTVEIKVYRDKGEITLKVEMKNANAYKSF